MKLRPVHFQEPIFRQALNPIAIFILVFIIFLALDGCARRPVLREKTLLYQLSPQERMIKLKQRSKFWTAYQAKLRIRTESSKGKYHIRGLVLAKLPHQIRLEVNNLWGQTVGVLVLNQENSTLWIASENVLYTADDAGSLIEHLLGFSIPPEILGYSLVGCVPLDQMSSEWQAHYDDFPWIGYSTDSKEGWTFTWKFHPETGALKAIDVVDSPWNYTLLYDPPVEMELESTPEKITYFSPFSSEWKMEVVIRQMQRSSDFQPSLFDPPFPGGVREIRLDQ
jgi:outer membrane biogenesis lipoprotein LolB